MMSIVMMMSIYDDDENADDGVDTGDYGVGGDVIPDN